MNYFSTALPTGLKSYFCICFLMAILLCGNAFSECRIICDDDELDGQLLAGDTTPSYLSMQGEEFVAMLGVDYNVELQTI